MSHVRKNVKEKLKYDFLSRIELSRKQIIRDQIGSLVLHITLY